MRKQKVYNTRADEKLEKLMEHFRPRFGNDEDIAILNTYTSIKKMLGDVNASEMRQLELKKLESSMTKKMKEVRMKEKGLIYSITKRNDEML